MSYEIDTPIYGDIQGASPYSVPNTTFVTVPYSGAPTLRGGVTWNAGTFEFTVPEKGLYLIQGWMALDTNVVVPGATPGRTCVEHLMAAFVNGAVARYIGNHMVTLHPSAMIGSASWLHGSVSLLLNAGDRVKLAQWQQGGLVWPAYVGPRSHWFQLSRLSRD